MFRLNLNGRWQLSWCEPGEGEAKGWPADGPAGDHCVEATVPGDVHVDLLEAGLIEEPLYGQNAADCRWMETSLSRPMPSPTASNSTSAGSTARPMST